MQLTPCPRLQEYIASFEPVSMLVTADITEQGTWIEGKPNIRAAERTSSTEHDEVWSLKKSFYQKSKLFQ